MKILKYSILSICSILLVIYSYPSFFSTSDINVEIIKSGEANLEGHRFILTNNMNIPLQLKKSFGLMLKLKMPVGKSATIGFSFQPPGKTVNCSPLAPNRANIISKLLAIVHPNIGTMYKDGDIITQIFKFDTTNELIPGEWHFNFCYLNGIEFKTFYKHKFTFSKLE